LASRLCFFGKAFKTGNSGKNQSTMAFLLSAVQFDPALRWMSLKDNVAAISPIAFISKSKIDENGLNYYLEIINEDFNQCARGIDMFCASVNRTKRVFGIVTLLAGDLPGRSALTGFMDLCYACKTTSLKDFFTEIITLRTTEEINDIGLRIGQGQIKTPYQQELASNNRMHFYSGDLKLI
jgi:hypothetical protein